MISHNGECVICHAMLAKRIRWVEDTFSATKVIPIFDPMHPSSDKEFIEAIYCLECGISYDLEHMLNILGLLR